MLLKGQRTHVQLRRLFHFTDEISMLKPLEKVKLCFNPYKGRLVDGLLLHSWESRNVNVRFLCFVHASKTNSWVRFIPWNEKHPILDSHGKEILELLCKD